MLCCLVILQPLAFEKGLIVRGYNHTGDWNFVLFLLVPLRLSVCLPIPTLTSSLAAPRFAAASPLAAFGLGATAPFDLGSWI